MLRTLERVALFTLALALLAAALPDSALAGKKPWEKINFPELGDVNIPGFDRHELDNGMVVYLMEDHTWPLVEGRFLVKTGGVYEPASKVGLASITGEVLRTGGTQNIPADTLDETLERMGASIESGIADTQGTVSFSFVSSDASRGMELLADVVRNPAFDEDKIEVSKTGQKAGIARRNDDLSGIRARELTKAVWGEDHPYARHTEYETIDAVTQADVVSFYKRWYHPNYMMLAVSGDFSSADMLATIQDLFGDWRSTNLPVPPLPDPPAEGQRRVLVADKTDVNQTSIAVGHVGMRADDPDYYAMSVMNRILGGGFGDRLFNEVRSRKGLAYSVGSSAGVGLSREGTFLAGVGTKSSTTQEALEAVLHEVTRIREEPVSDDELSDAKEAILNSHVFNFVRPSQVLNRLQRYEFLGYSSDFLDRYVEGIRSVDKDKVLDVAQRRIKPDEFSIVAVGKTEDWDGDLTAFGPVEKLDISIPEPKGEEFPPPTAETIEKGRAILAAAQKAMGGNALASVKSVTTEQSLALSMGGMEMAATGAVSVAYPDRMHMSFKLPFGEMVNCVNGESAWMKGPQGIQDAPASQAADMRSGLLKDPFYVLGHYDEYEVQALDGESVEGKPANVVLVRVEDDWVKLYIDSASNHLVKTATIEKDMMTNAPGLQEMFYSDYRKVDGVLVSHAQRMLQAGEQQMSIEVTKVVINPRLEASLFDKPES